MFDEPLFRYMMNRKKFSMSAVADQLGMNEVTLYRKIKGKSDFSRAEIQALKSILGMSNAECISVFFAE